MNWMECLGLSASNLLSVKKSLKNARKVGGVILANPSAAKTDYQKARESDLGFWSLMNWMECLGLSASNLLSVKKSLKNARKVGGVILANLSAAKTDYQKARESDLGFWSLMNWMDCSGLSASNQPIRQQAWEDNLSTLNAEDNSLWGIAKSVQKKNLPISALNGPTSHWYCSQDTNKTEVIAHSLEKQFHLNDIHNPRKDEIITSVVDAYIDSNINNTDIIPHSPI
ncbi:hypothetical protein TNCV_4190911 [Trichonephila clavipes]|nr:hypothetical protein TNCV_4190911 [Trichonephila clavipes]